MNLRIYSEILLKTNTSMVVRFVMILPNHIAVEPGASPFELKLDSINGIVHSQLPFGIEKGVRSLISDSTTIQLVIASNV